MKFLEALLAAVLAVFAPIKMIIITTLVLVFADLFTGMIAAYKRGELMKSSAMRRTVTKILVYLSAVCLGFLVETYMLEGYLAVSKIVAGLIGVVELKSILENLDNINGSPLFKSLIKKLGSVNDDIKEDVKDQITGQKED
jgi:phage-related holin